MAKDLSRVVPKPASGKPQPKAPNAGTWRDPSQYDPAYLSQVGGQALVDVYEGLSQLPGTMYDVLRGFMERQRQKSPEELRGTADPYDTATYDAAMAAIEGAAREPVKTAKSAASALAEYGKKAVSSPAGMTQFLAENLTPLPRMPSGPGKMEIKAYHGTPHRFPATEANPLGEFDASKIGTGEGAQAYGHGIYFAESPKVAKGYATEIPYRDFERKVAKVYDEFDSPDDALLALKEAGLSEAQLRVVKALEKDDWLGFDYPHQAVRAALKEPQNFDLSPETKSALQGISSLYKADLPDEMIDRMLDWDKPLSEQPENVKKALKKIPAFKELQKTAGLRVSEGRNINNWSGSFIHRALQDQAGNLNMTQNEISAVLRQAGIPGIKYLDAGSRGQGGSGTRNFVVFPGEEKKVKILERDGPRGERTTAAPVSRTPQAPPVYHVTHTKYLPNIKKKGLLPLQTSNWVKASNRERYGGGDVYAFSTREDAERWAAKMDWAFNQKIGSGKISIVTVNRPENVKFDIDQNDPISQISNAGPWLKTSERIPAKNIVSAEEFTKDTAPGFFGNVIGKATDGE